MKRRDFIIKSMVFAAGGVLAANPCAQAFSQPDRQISILYTNDTHGRIDPFPATAVRHAGLGGITRRATLVRSIRRQSPNCLLLDGGDVFHGTPWFNLYGGKKNLELMSMMGYDAMCPGDHEFDNGLDGFAEAASAADFPFICSNYRVKGTPMASFVQPYMTRELAGIRLGIFGLGIRLRGNIRPELYGDVLYGSPADRSEVLVSHLRERHRCDYIICLSHLGYSYSDDRIDDLKLASKVGGIDLIIGGHTHTFMDNPALVRTPEGGKTLVTQAGHGGIRLGRIDLTVTENGSVTVRASHQYTVGEGRHRHDEKGE